MKHNVLGFIFLSTSLLVLPSWTSVAMDDVLGSDSVSTKSRVSALVPMGTSIKDAIKAMEKHGFKCQINRNVRFAEDNPEGGEQLIHGPSDTLWCDTGDVSRGLLISKRWQVTFTIDSSEQITGIFVSVGITGL